MPLRVMSFWRTCFAHKGSAPNFPLGESSQNLSAGEMWQSPLCWCLHFWYTPIHWLAISSSLCQYLHFWYTPFCQLTISSSLCQWLYLWYTPVHCLAICCFHFLYYKEITLKVWGHVLLWCSKYIFYLNLSIELKWGLVNFNAIHYLSHQNPPRHLFIMWYDI